MSATYNLFERYGTIAPATPAGPQFFAQARYNIAPVSEQQIYNRVYSNDATNDYGTYVTSGVTGFFDAQFGLYGVGSARYYIDGSTFSPTIKMPSSSYYDTGASSYKSGTVYVWSDQALSFRLDMQLQDGSGNAVGSTDSTTLTITPNKWNKIVVTSSSQGQKFLMTLNVLSVVPSTDTGKMFYLDGVQVEDNPYATTVVSQPLRVANDLKYSVSKYAPDWTAMCWTVAGPQVSSSAGGSHPFFTLYQSSTSYATLDYQRGSTKIQAFKYDVSPNTDLSITGVTVNPGDIIFGALVHDGLGFTGYFGKMGDTSLQSVSGTTDFDYFNTIYIGKDPTAGTYANAPVEQFLLYNKALTGTELQSIFASSTPLDYLSDNRIIFASGVPSTLGTTNAQSTLGTGSYRNLNRTAVLNIVPTSGMNSTYVPYGSSSHMVYGADVEKLQLFGIISTGTDTTSSTLYRIDGIIDVPNAGKTAFATKM